jgi:HK97 family phage portal protein
MLINDLNIKQFNTSNSGYSNYPSLIQGKNPDTITSNTGLIELGNQSWQAICNRRNSQTMAGIELKLYYKNKTNKKLLTSKSITKQQKEHLKLTKKEYNDVEEIIEHPVLDILNGKDYNYSELVEMIALYLGSLGAAYVRIIREGKKIISLEPLLSEYVTPIVEGYGTLTPNEGKIIAYKYQTNYKSEQYPAEDILEFLNYNPGNKILGVADLQLCLDAALRNKYYDQYEKYMAANNARPDFVISAKIPEKEAEGWYRKFIKDFRGAKNTGKPQFLNGEYKFDVLNFKPNELNFIEGRKEAKETICAAYGVPLSMITNDNINRATSFAGLESYCRFTIYPKLSKIIEVLNTQLVTTFDPNLYLWYDEMQLVDSELVAERVMKQVQAGIITIDEAREKLGYEAMEITETPKEPKEEDKNEE